MALHQIMRLAHPLLGQVTTQKEHPQQCKIQPFSEHISHCIDYFQCEACYGHHYPLNEWVILIISRLHLIWRDATKKKYIHLVPRNGIIPPVPLEFHLEMISVTLVQWCEKECLELLTSHMERPSNPSAPLFAV
jgi:hypothetical protein